MREQRGREERGKERKTTGRKGRIGSQKIER